MTQKLLTKLYDLTYSIMFGAIAAILLMSVADSLGYQRNVEYIYFLTTVLSISRIALTVIKFFIHDSKM